MTADLISAITFVDEVPKMRRGRTEGASKYDALVEFLQLEENTGKWVMLPDEYSNVQASTRLNKLYGDKGIVASSRRVEGSPDDAKKYNVYVAHEPFVDEDEDGDE